jgi:hypothetical protein
MQGSAMQIKARPGASGVRAPRSRGALNIVAKQYTGPPPAWNKRVVVPEVQPRDGPKVRAAPGAAAGGARRGARAPPGVAARPPH